MNRCENNSFQLLSLLDNFFDTCHYPLNHFTCILTLSLNFYSLQAPIYHDLQYFLLTKLIYEHYFVKLTNRLKDLVCSTSLFLACLSAIYHTRFLFCFE